MESISYLSELLAPKVMQVGVLRFRVAELKLCEGEFLRMKTLSTTQVSHPSLLVATLEIAMDGVAHTLMKLLEEDNGVIDGGAHIHIDVPVHDRFHDSALQTVHGDHILRAQPSFHEIHRMLTLTLDESKLLFVEATVDDAHGEVSRVLPLHDRVQHNLLIRRALQNPLHVSQRDRPHFAVHTHLLETVLEKRPVLKRAHFPRVQHQYDLPVFLVSLHRLEVARGFQLFVSRIDKFAEALIGRRRRQGPDDAREGERRRGRKRRGGGGHGGWWGVGLSGWYGI